MEEESANSTQGSTPAPSQSVPPPPPRDTNDGSYHIRGLDTDNIQTK